MNTRGQIERDIVCVGKRLARSLLLFRLGTVNTACVSVCMPSGSPLAPRRITKITLVPHLTQLSKIKAKFSLPGMICAPACTREGENERGLAHTYVYVTLYICMYAS